MLDLLIREATLDEIEYLRQIFNKSRGAAGCYPQNNMSVSDFNHLIAGEELYLATDKNEGIIVGFIGIIVDCRFVHHLYVLPQFQGQGVGRKLLQKCAEVLDNAFTLKCDDCNQKAMLFYSNLGFAKVASGVGDFGPWTELRATRV